MSEYTDAELESITEIGEMVYERAKFIFKTAGCPDDFCVQYTGLDSAIFGGINRLCWSALYGFLPDYNYCTDKFLLSMKQQGIGKV